MIGLKQKLGIFDVV